MDENFLKNELSLKKLFEVLDDYLKLVKKWKIPAQRTRISITGGEPLIRKDFFEFLERCYQYKDLTKYGILTNGILVDDETVKRFKKLEVDYIQVSLEGMEVNNDYIRGEGTFKKIIKTVEILVKEGINVGISVTMTKKNKEDVKSLVKLAKELGATNLGLRRLVPIGIGEGIKNLMLSAQDVKKLYLYATEENKELLRSKSKLKIGMGCEDGILAQEGYLVNDEHPS
jgi:MoaA/NifB/PqqE/SkfB family radical SAM enzyme